MNTEYILEFHKIKEKLKEYALTESAKQKIDELNVYLSEAELRARLKETTEARILLEKAGDPPFTSLNGIRENVFMAEKGGCLSPKELEAIAASLTAVARLKSYLKRCKQFEVGLAFYEENMDPLDEIRDEIAEKIRGNEVDDYASKLLKSTRAAIETAEAKMREKADSVMKAQKECMADSFSTTRSGHICIPVKKDCRSRIAGSVLDKSSTGNTLFIEPASVAKYYSEIELLRLTEENEVRRILYTISGMLAGKSEMIENNARTIEKLDFIFAKGKLSVEMEGMEPDINLERKIVLKDARHPLMDKNISVPLQFSIGNGTNGIVITGPNTGGKTVAIKTVALNSLMAQCGLHVSCKEADICMNSMYLCDIGDGQNLSENLSTFSAHITNVLDILKQADQDSLVIMDELGSGTDPMEGMGIAVAILEELRKSGCLYLVTTHYPEVKNYAEKADGVVNARMTFDKESLKPRYQMVIGEAGESCAFYIASRLGMSEEMLRVASKAAYGTNAPKVETYVNHSADRNERQEKKSKLQKKKKVSNDQSDALRYNIGDSVMVLPDKKIGIVCEKADEQGNIRVQVQGKKIYVSHKRIQLQVSAASLYPEDYDFSIIFDSVENRKLSHQMDRKYVEGLTLNREE